MANSQSEDVRLRSAEMRTRILDKAESLFRHYGYAKTTVADIAGSLAMSSANIYRFYRAKTEIHEALVNRMLAKREAALQTIVDCPCSAAERLKTFVVEESQVTIVQLLDDTRVHEMVAVALEEHWPIIDRHIQRITDLLGRIIDNGMQSGEFVRGDAMTAARLFRASTMLVLHPAFAAHNRLDPGSVDPGELVDFILRALKT